MQYLVHANLSLEGWHCWPNAPARQKFLAERHRHQFQIKVTASASGADRAVECFDLLDAARACLEDFRSSDGTYDFGNMSCEHIAEHLISNLPLVACMVLEDGLQGATVMRDEA